MMASFIYVFDRDAYDRLIELQYQLIKADFDKNIFVFLNEKRYKLHSANIARPPSDAAFQLGDIQYILSDTLTFSDSKNEKEFQIRR